MDYNVIQAPELLARLTRRLGLKQAHIASTLNEGVQAVVLLDDVSREEAGEGSLGFIAGTGSIAIGAGLGLSVGLRPGIGGNATIKARLRRIHLQIDGAPLVTILGGVANVLSGGFSSPTSYPKGGGTPPGASQWVIPVYAHSFAAWSALSGLNIFLHGIFDGAGGEWRIDWDDDGPTILPGQQFTLFVNNSTGSNCGALIEWDEG